MKPGELREWLETAMVDVTDKDAWSPFLIVRCAGSDEMQVLDSRGKIFYYYTESVERLTRLVNENENESR